MHPNSGTPEWWVGQRVVDEEGYRATVRYIGPVATAKDKEALYIGEDIPWRHSSIRGALPSAEDCMDGFYPEGVEWDDPTRGKHDGSVVKDDVSVALETDCVLKTVYHFWKHLSSSISII
jgi:hypothetical protein